MEFKRLIINGLKSYKTTLMNEARSYKDKLNGKENEKLKFYAKRIADSETIIKTVEGIEFSTNIRPVLSYLSEYGTFCDRKTMYYDPKIETMELRSIIQIIMCEFFNAFQDYYMIKNSDEICQTSLDVYLGTTLILMYHIGLLGQNNPIYLPKYQGHRANVPGHYFGKYGMDSLMWFYPSINAAKYLMEKALFDNQDETYGTIQETWNTNGVISFKYWVKFLDVKSKEGLKLLDDNKEKHCIYVTENDHSLLKSNTKLVKVHDEAVQIAKKLSQQGA